MFSIIENLNQKQRYFIQHSVCGAVASLVLFVSVILRIIYLANGYGIGDPMQYGNGKYIFENSFWVFIYRFPGREASEQNEN